MGKLRALFDALQLIVTYHHARKEADVEIALQKGLEKKDLLKRVPCPRSEPGQT